jgi:hypothetical protein
MLQFLVITDKSLAMGNFGKKQMKAGAEPIAAS